MPVRHETMYGSLDVDCDCSNTALFEAVAAKLPKDALWFHSPLKRTVQTADALIAAGAQPSIMTEDARIIEMDFGDLNGKRIDELVAERTDSYIGFFPVSPYEKAPNGEDFSDMCKRVGQFTDEMHANFTGQDIVCVAHRGTIMAALSIALQLPLHTSVSFVIDNVSLSRLSRHKKQSDDGPEYKLAELGWIP